MSSFIVHWWLVRVCYVYGGCSMYVYGWMPTMTHTGGAWLGADIDPSR